MKKCSGRNKLCIFSLNPASFAQTKKTRVVRVGSTKRFRGRLSDHRGTVKSGGGNHSGSVFRHHVGSALLRRNPELGDLQQWLDDDSSKSPEVRKAELKTERAVSAHIRSMPFLWINTSDESDSKGTHPCIKPNAIALLSRISPSGKNQIDQPSENWLGHDCVNPAVPSSWLWNVRHTTDTYDPAFLDEFELRVDGTNPI